MRPPMDFISVASSLYFSFSPFLFKAHADSRSKIWVGVMKIKIFLRTACVWCYFIYEYAALKVALKMVPDPLLLLTFLARKVSP